mgnify:CR=1 FL=1
MIIMGDANGDGKITSADTMAIQLHVLGIATLTGDKFTAADVNKDDKITSVDALIVDRHIQGVSMITEVIE